MIWAREEFRGAARLAADGSRAVGVSIEQRMDLAGAIARDDQRAKAEAARDEIIGLRYFALVSQKRPRSAEDLFHFKLKDRGVGI